MRRLVIWTALVSGCALPMLLATWTRFSPGERFGELCGIVVWIAATAAIERSDRFLRLSAALRSGAPWVMVLQCLTAVTPTMIGLFLFFTPALLVTSWLDLLPGAVADFHATLVLTVMCGAQCAAMAVVLGRVAQSVLALWTKVR
jgi:hypothetical protein